MPQSNAPTPAKTPRKPQVTISIPVLRERDNIQPLVEEIAESLAGVDFSWEILFVDDDSQDGSKELCAELANRHPVRLYERKGEKGLASAIIEGLRQARGEVVVTMDGDHSHPPASLPGLITPILEGRADFCMGSRFAKGGSADPNQTLYRYLVAQIAKLLSLGLAHGLSDPGSGFFALRADMLPDLSRVLPVGYKMGLALRIHGDFRRDRLAEVPIDFRTRSSGKSKLGGGVILGYIVLLAHLYVVRFIRKPLARLIGSA